MQLLPPVLHNCNKWIVFLLWFHFYLKDHCGNNKTSDYCVSLGSEHSMAETLTVALRVAEEAIDEAISKAEFDTASQVIYVVHIL